MFNSASLNQIHYEILKLLYDTYGLDMVGGMAPEEIAKKLELPLKRIQGTLVDLGQQRYIVLSETTVGIRIYRFAKITAQGIALLDKAMVEQSRRSASAGIQRGQTTYNLIALRTLLIAAFTDADLHDFCYDRPLFRPVYEQFSRGMGKDEMIRRLIEYVETRDLFEELLAAVKEVNPRQYVNYEAEFN